MAKAGLGVAYWPVRADHHATRHGLATVDALWATADAARLASGFIEASEHSLSPNETRCRIRCRFALPGVRLVVEFDGADHREAARHTQDVVKEDALRRVGLEVVRVTGSEVDDELLVGDRVRAGRARARFEPEVDRRWRARPPRDTLPERIEERAFLRAGYASGPPAR